MVRPTQTLNPIESQLGEQKPPSDTAPGQATCHVVATGVFDLLHLGHLHFLMEAKKLGDRLTVIVAHDETVRRLKREPVVPSSVRAELVSALKPVDDVMMGQPGDMLVVIKELKPDIIALGHDQYIFEPQDLEHKLSQKGLQARVVRLPCLEHGLAGTRRIIQRVIELYYKTNLKD